MTSLRQRDSPVGFHQPRACNWAPRRGGGGDNLELRQPISIASRTGRNLSLVENEENDCRTVAALVEKFTWQTTAEVNHTHGGFIGVCDGEVVFEVVYSACLFITTYF